MSTNLTLPFAFARSNPKPHIMTSLPSLKLTYFDFSGRAEAIRKTLALGGVPFVDERLSYAEFQQRKSSYPYGQVPVLEVNGELYAETQGLLRYAARLAGLYPPSSEPVAQMLVDELLSTLEDMFDRLLQSSFDEKDPAIVQQMREQVLAGSLPAALELIDTRLQQINAHPFFMENKKNVYLHEVLVWDNVVFFRSGELKHIPTTLVDNYKTMIDTFDKVVASPTVAKSLPMDPTTPQPPAKKLKLTYFDVVGRGEHIRLACQIGGIPFEDERLTEEAFQQRKHLFPNAQVPVLWMDEQIVAAQSFALLRYIGRLTGMYPTDNLLMAMKIDEIIGHITELDTFLVRCMNEQDTEKKKTEFTLILQKKIPDALRSLNERVKQWKTQGKSSFAVGEKLTIADLAIYNLLLDLKTTIVDVEDLVPYDQLNLTYDTVAKHPRVVEWYKTKEHK